MKRSPRTLIVISALLVALVGGAAASFAQSPPPTAAPPIAPQTLIDISLDDALLADAEEDSGADDDDDAPGPTHLTLPEAIDIALERSFQVRAATHAIRKAEARYGEANLAWTPKIEINAQLAPVPRQQADDADFDVFDDLSSWGILTNNKFEFVMPLFTFFKLSTAEDLAQVGINVERLRRAEAEMKVAYDVARAYYGLQVARALETVVKDGGGFLTKAQKSLDKLLDAGNTNVDDSDRYQLEVAGLEFDRRVVQVRQAKRLALDGLRVHTLIEGPISIPKMHFRVEELELKTLEETLALALDNRLDLAMLDEALEAQRLKLKLENLYWAPDFYLAGRVNYSFSNAVPDVPEDLGAFEFFIYDPANSFGFGALVGLQWKIDISQRIYRVEQEEHGLAQLRAQRELARRGATLDIEKAYFDVESALASVNILYSSRRAAKRRMTQLYADYETGGGDVDRLVRAIGTYFELRAAYLQGLYDFRIAVFMLQLKTGAESISSLLKSGALEDLPEEGATDAPEDDADPDE